MTVTAPAAAASSGPAADRRAAALALVRDGEFGAASALLRELIVTQGESAARWLTGEIVEAMQADDLRFAGDLARINAMIRHGPRPVVPASAAGQPGVDERRLSVGKLEHDIDQLGFLRALGVAGPEVDDVVVRYRAMAAALRSGGEEARRSLDPDEQATVGDVYGRLTYVRETPRVERALSSSWDRTEVEDRYLGARPGVVVIDDFLTPDALTGLRRFCLESTVWNANRYPHGRLGSFFDSGFNCPLVLQVAEEIRDAFPRVIGGRHTLRQLWGFKYPPQLPAASTIHADFAAVNVNFWITPTGANRDPDTGGLVVYDADAPPDWDFRTYNERLDLIKDFLRRTDARVIHIPYRENRAIIFNSDLFHATAEVNFGSGYEERRVNITMLYGVRELDDLHPQLSGRRAVGGPPTMTPAWRSAALSRGRRR